MSQSNVPLFGSRVLDLPDWPVDAVPDDEKLRLYEKIVRHAGDVS